MSLPIFLRTAAAGLFIGLSGLAVAQAPIQLADAVREYAIHSGGDPRTQEFRHAGRDLDGDGREDAVVLMLGRDYCGTGGCTLLIFRGAEDGHYVFLSATTLVREPVRVSLRERRHGWASLIVHERDRGEVLLRFEGRRYPPSAWGLPLAGGRRVKAAELLIE